MADANKVPFAASRMSRAANVPRIIAALAASIIIVALTLYVSYELNRIGSSEPTQNSIGTQSWPSR